MRQPSRLPTAEAELAEWSVYADHLLTQGDPLGEYLARELALPAAIERAAVDEFQRVAKRVCKQGRAVRVAWCLGHVRMLEIPPDTLSGVGVQFVAPQEGTLARATEIVRAPRGRLVESLRFVHTAGGSPRHWKRLFAALPATCRRVEVGVFRATYSELEDLIAQLPATVRDLVYHASFPTQTAPEVVTAAIRDRFETVEIRTRDIATLAPFAGPIAARLDELDELDDAPLFPGDLAPRRVQVRVHRIGGLAGAMARCTLGAPGDAAIVARSVGVAYTLPRESLLAVQQRNGIVPVRTQLAGLLPERHMDSVRWEGGSHYSLVRRGERWTYQALDGAPIVDVADGMPFGNGYELVTHDVDVRCRAMLGL